MAAPLAKRFWLTATALLAFQVMSAQSGSAEVQFSLEVVTEDLVYPWGVAFLPGGGFLVSERDGVLKHVDGDGNQSVVPGTPEVFANGQGGLLDIALAPDFERTREVYLSFSEGSAGGAGTSVFRGRLTEQGGGYALEDGQVIFSGNNRSHGGRHFGSRLVFAPDETLFVTTGDRGEGERAQNPGDHAGAVLRIDRNGKAPDDNPFSNVSGHLAEIWSIGHRNPQGATLHPETGELWTVEHGARGGDEINRPKAGRNYGWPVISFGRHYSGGKIGEGMQKDGMEQPVHYWDPSIAPSGMAFVDSPLFPEWNGSLLVGALRGQHIARLEFKDGKVVTEQQLLVDLEERIRDVRQGPDGYIYFLTDSDEGRLIRMKPR
ncbi:PQQ-dependent sugar dehydrogenase [Roseibium sediminis]|uniref:PQQ-dependent sugar dehydrogenase n=1 Tax=Roseibium sediminis TaxID=1775174 RepID=UPI001AD916D5|nr:PQQ-dependent sugar dehydrogenase [Roseibium sediminis]